MTTLHDCRQLDATDPLRPWRAHFSIPAKTIYRDGNSLGVLPVAAAARAAQVVQQEWGQGLIRSWNAAGWFDLPQRLGARIASLIGAGADEVVAADSTSVNLFKVLAAAIRIAQHANPARRVIVSERSNFPTDLYIAEALCQSHGCSLQLVEANGVQQALGPQVAVLMLTHVNYRSGAMHDMAASTAAAHAAGALVVWDLAHSAGAVPVDLRGADADFAVGCGIAGALICHLCNPCPAGGAMQRPLLLTAVTAARRVSASFCAARSLLSACLCSNAGWMCLPPPSRSVA